MLLSDLSIKRPVLATMLNVVLVIFGLFALPKLAIDLYPDVDFPVVTVQVMYPGADPESIEQKILKPLEKELNGISGLKSLAAQAFPNLGQLVLQFNLEKDSDDAAQQVRDKVFGSLGELPPEAETPIVRKFDVGGAPIMNIALQGDLGATKLSTISKDIVQPALERVDGVASVTPAGLREREIQVLIDRARLSSFGLSAQSIAAAIKSQNLDVPSGKVLGSTSYYPVRMSGKKNSARELSLLPIPNARNSNVRIYDVAEVKDHVADEENAAFINDKPTILFAIQKQGGANSPEVADKVRKEVALIKQSLPAGVSLDIITDNSVFIKASLDAVKFDLIIGALLAIFIVLLFLKDIRITMISAVALPTAVIATFAFMKMMGFSMNMMTTLALSLSIGILIDDAIIVVENIHRHLSMGKSGLVAAKDATREIGLAVIATTLTLCAVFVPVAFMQGIIGRFFFQFGLTVAFAVLVSLFVAFTLTPMLSSKFLIHHHGDRHRNYIFASFDKVFNRIENAYKSLLQWCLLNRGKTLLAGLGIFILSIVMLKFVPVSFFPTEDRSEFSIEYELPEGTNLNFTKEKSLILSEAVRAYPGVSTVVTTVGASSDQKPNKATLSVKLIDKSQRSFSQFDLMNRLRDDLKGNFERDGAQISIGVEDGGPKSQPIQFVFKSNDWPLLESFSDQVAGFTKDNIAGAVDVMTTKPKAQEEYKVAIDAARAADLSLSPAVIGANLRSLFAGERLGNIDIEGQNVDISLRIADQNRTNEMDLAQILIPTERGSLVSLNSVATILPSTSP
ncbi:MAG TPA: efflux RND transporter permease subunit, partial [Myxococcota bacterium]|nr:efflux RND transporter permease subunit [Myxococcota bacterium]